MEKTKEIFLKYKSARDVVFIFGAGTSYPDGVPLQKQILPKILSTSNPHISNSEIGKLFLEFFKDNFYFNSSLESYPTIEAVFGFLDYFIEHHESLNQKYPYNKLVDIKEYFIKLIHYIVNLETEKSSIHYDKFWDAVKKYNSNISIITLNYDTLLEHSFEKFYSKFGFIDYCLYFMNYEKDLRVKNFNFWINPREPVTKTGEEDPVPIKIIKVHGSLNWKYCNCCGQVLLTPWDRKIDLNKGKFLGYTYPDNKEYEYSCPIDGTDFQTLIIPPSYLKIIKPPIISSLLSEAGKEIRLAKKIVFVGYSLSDPDIQIKALLKKNLNSETEILVINPRNNTSFKSRYFALSEKIKFRSSTFEELVMNDEFISSILA